MGILTLDNATNTRFNLIGASCISCASYRSGHCLELEADIAARIAAAIPFCPIGRHGRTPVFDWRRIRSRLRTLVAAAISVSVFLLRRCRPTSPVLVHRRAVCAGCVENKRLAWIRYCGMCKCWLRAKTALSYQRCPVGNWEAVKDDACKPPLGLRVLQKGCCNGGR